jgi:hypothetical protein
MHIIDALRRIAPHFDRYVENKPRALPQDPLIAAYGRDVGPRTAEHMSAFTSAVGGHAISRKNLSERLFSFADNTALAFLFEEKAYKPTDPYVAQSAVRRRVAENLRAEGGGREVAFVETSGMLEVGGGFMTSMAIDVLGFGGVGWGYGVTLSSLMRYRTSMPLLLGFGEEPEDCFKRQKLSFPFSAQNAMDMVPGSEIEITGQGRVNVSLGIGSSFGVSAAGATAGVGTLLGAWTNAKGEFNLNVMALDKPGMVRVTIRNLDEETAGFIARLRAGLNFSPGALGGTVLGGILRYYVEKMNAPYFEELVNTYTTMNASIYSTAEHRGVLIGSWDINLEDEQARDAYENLIRLNTVPANELVVSGSGSVTKSSAQENETLLMFGADLAIIGEKLMLQEMLHTNRVGRLDRASGNSLVYHNSIYTKRRKNIVTGTKQVHWEAVSVKNAHSDDSEPHLHLHFQQKDWDYGQNTLKRMLRFAAALKIPHLEMIGEDKQHADDVSVRLTQRAEVLVNADIYFTKKGLENIDRSNAKDATEAYLTVSSQIRKKFANVDFVATDKATSQAIALIRRYNNLTDFSVSQFYERLRARPRIREDYKALTGRDIDQDATLIREADEFGATVEALTNYMQSAAALARLATHEETLINDLSITSGDIVIRNISAGPLEHPRQTVAAELHRVADG